MSQSNAENLSKQTKKRASSCSAKSLKSYKSLHSNIKRMNGYVDHLFRDQLHQICMLDRSNTKDQPERPELGDSNIGKNLKIEFEESFGAEEDELHSYSSKLKHKSLMIINEANQKRKSSARSDTHMTIAPIFDQPMASDNQLLNQSADHFQSPSQARRHSIKKSPLLSPTLMKTEGHRKNEEDKSNLLPINEQDSENEHSCAVRLELPEVYKLE